MKLLSMTQFVLQEKENSPAVLFNPKNPSHVYRAMLNAEAFNRKIIAYADFLSRFLSIGMFVPVNPEGKILVEPTQGISGNDQYEGCEMDEWGKAQKNVLFEGVEIKNCKSQLDGEEFVGITVNGQWCGGWENFKSSYLNGGDTIEALTLLKGKLVPELTEVAIKQLGM